MKTTNPMKTLGSALVLLGLTTATTPSAQAQAVQRDIEEWRAARTQFFQLINNPDINGDGVADGLA